MNKEKKPLRKEVATWEWRKNFKVWEADRKIFLYPDNWLEPDLALPVGCLAALRRLVAAVREQCAARRRRVRNPRSACPRGVPVLLTGKNRAGALVAGQTLARDLGMNLYRVDLSHVASKYIGETEKNLRRVFHAAEKGDAVLLFDEADALLRKRTGVKDSHDRYASIEINYLLRGIGAFGGLVILSTNRRRGLDEAFLRRFHSVIHVPNRAKARQRAKGR